MPASVTLPSGATKRAASSSKADFENSSPMTAARPDASTRPGPAQPLHVLGALALELRGDAPVAHASLAQAEAGELAAHMARDLASFAPEAAQLQLATVGAHYDPVELLRPGWALHRELDQLAARAPGDTSGRIIAFGAHEEQLPGALAPSPDHFGGPLRLVQIRVIPLRSPGPWVR